MKDPAALLYIDTWKQATTEMNAISRAYYMDLILHQYDKGSLPDDIEELANICRVRFSEFEQFEQVFEQVLKHKFKLNDSGRLENEFAKEIIRRREKFVKKRSEAGKLSYVLRYFRSNFKVNKGFENFIKKNIDLDFDIKNEQVLEQVFKQISELYINGDGDGDKYIDNKEIYSFDDFWNDYDLKIGKKICEPKFKKLTDKQKQKIKETLPAFLSKIKDKKYQPHPSTYLNQERWNDEITNGSIIIPIPTLEEFTTHYQNKGKSKVWIDNVWSMMDKAEWKLKSGKNVENWKEQWN